MGFLIKLGFWLSLTLMVIPFGGVGRDHQVETVSPMQAFHAAREALGDVAGICGRKPEICATGKAAMTTIGVRAREGAKFAYEYLDNHYGEPDDAVHTGSVPQAE